MYFSIWSKIKEQSQDLNILSNENTEVISEEEIGQRLYYSCKEQDNL